MTEGGRLSIGYVVPGHHLLPSAGPTRNVLSLAGALAPWADVTVAFRSVLEAPRDPPFRVVEIGSRGGRPGARADDAAIRGVGPVEFFGYLGSIRRFVTREAASFDVVLEKSWLLSGYVAARCERLGVPAILVENIPPMLREPLRGARDLPRRLRLEAARRVAGSYARRVKRVIAETDDLKEALVRIWGIPEGRIDVVPLGIDRGLFHPRDREEAREKLGVPRGATVLLYAGVLDRTHNLAPFLEALRSAPQDRFEVHVVGDGALRGEYERLAAGARVSVRFHGRVPHERMPDHIAAADLCLAPYEASFFPEGRVVYSTLKIPEYLASGRPVASVPSGNILRLVRPGDTGFLLENRPAAWAEFLRHLPSRERLWAMGEEAARNVPAPGWEETARRYLSICEREAARRGRRAR